LKASFLAGMSPALTFPPSLRRRNPELMWTDPHKASFMTRSVPKLLHSLGAVPTSPILRAYALLLFGARLEAVALRESRHRAGTQFYATRPNLTLLRHNLPLAALNALAGPGRSAKGVRIVHRRSASLAYNASERVSTRRGPDATKHRQDSSISPRR
jgi:hypothetical protein